MSETPWPTRASRALATVLEDPELLQRALRRARALRGATDEPVDPGALLSISPSLVDAIVKASTSPHLDVTSDVGPVLDTYSHVGLDSLIDVGHGTEFDWIVNAKIALIGEITRVTGPGEDDDHVPLIQFLDELEVLEDAGAALPVGFATASEARSRIEERGRAVGRLAWSGAGGALPAWGTATFIEVSSGSWLLSNRHVLVDRARAAQAVLRIDYTEQSVSTGMAAKTMPLRADTLRVSADPMVDAAAVRVDVPAHLVAEVAHVEVQPGRAPVRHMPAYIIQHPRGGTRKIGRKDNEIAEVDAKSFRYISDTLPGSSGAPVFDHAFELVGVHSEAVDGKVSVGSDGTKYFANQGHPIAAVLAALGL